MFYTDIHTHLLCHVDDGAESTAMMQEMLDVAYRDGTRTLCLTPHYDPKPHKSAEMTVEDDYAMIDGQINNGRRDEVKEKPSIRERLAEAKRECAERPTPEKAREGRGTPEHGSL